MSSKADRSEKRFTKAEKSWIMYDWANSIYATNIMAAIFPIYFAMQADETGNKLYGFAVSARCGGACANTRRDRRLFRHEKEALRRIPCAWPCVHGGDGGV